MSRFVWCNGEILAEEAFRVSPFDRGLTLGLGLFETMLAIDGRPVFFTRHAARHAAGCARLGWAPVSEAVIREAIPALLEANGLTTGRVRIRWFVTGGEGPFNDPSVAAGGMTVLTATSAAFLPAAVSLALSPWPRNERSPIAGLKAASYAENLLALSHARAAGAEEALILNTAGELCETAFANLFVVKGGTVVTPPLSSGCLPGVTRGVLLECCAELGIPAVEAPLFPDDLLSADEAFLTSSIRGPVPVSTFQGRDLAAGGHPLTTRLKEGWEAAIRCKDAG